jgi:hypothetical protein
MDWSDFTAGGWSGSREPDRVPQFWMSLAARAINPLRTARNAIHIMSSLGFGADFFESTTAVVMSSVAIYLLTSGIGTPSFRDSERIFVCARFFGVASRTAEDLERFYRTLSGTFGEVICTFGAPK